MTGPLWWTTARWCNRQDEAGHWAKVLAHKGSYTQFLYGTDTPSYWNRPDLQVAIICSKQSGVIAIDVDRPEAFDGSFTSQHLLPDDASTTRWDPKLEEHRFHVLVDMRTIPHYLWPSQSWTAWGDVKANGFVPWPGSWHHNNGGDPIRYEPANDNGWPHAVPATMELVADLQADIANRPAREGSSGSAGGTGGGHSGEMMGFVMKLAWAGKSDDEITTLFWAKAEAEQDPSWPYSDEDFERYLDTARSRVAAREAQEEQDKQWWRGMRRSLAR